MCLKVQCRGFLATSWTPLASPSPLLCPPVSVRYLWEAAAWSSSESGWQQLADTRWGTLPPPPASHSCAPAGCKCVWSHRGVSPAGCHLWSPRCSRWRRQFWGSHWDRGAGLWRPRPHHERKHCQTGWPQPSGRCWQPQGSYLRERECDGEL